MLSDAVVYFFAVAEESEGQGGIFGCEVGDEIADSQAGEIYVSGVSTKVEKVGDLVEVGDH